MKPTRGDMELLDMILEDEHEINKYLSAHPKQKREVLQRMGWNVDKLDPRHYDEAIHDSFTHAKERLQKAWNQDDEHDYADAPTYSDDELRKRVSRRPVRAPIKNIGENYDHDETTKKLLDHNLKLYKLIGTVTGHAAANEYFKNPDFKKMIKQLKNHMAKDPLKD